MADTPSLLFINQHYYPDFASTAQHLTDLAEHLSDQGFEVHAMCSAGHYLSGSMDVPMEETHNGVHIHRVRATAFGRDTLLGRLTDYASFFLQVLWRVLTGPRYDSVVTLTTPPLIALVATVARMLRGQSYGIWSMDLHPDAEVAVGMLGSSHPVTRLLHALNNWAYRRADFVVDLGPYMKRRLREKGVPDERLHTIPVWNKKEEVYPIPDDENPLVEEVGLQDKFVVMYSGNAGLGHRFDEVLAAMKHFDGHPNISFLFVGSGPRKEEITAFAEEHALSNFQYLSYFPREQIRYSLSLADVHLLTLYNDMAGVAVPGKLYGILATGKPVLMLGPEASDSGGTILKHDVGMVVDPRDEADASTRFIEAVETLYENEKRRRAMGTRGREVFLDHFEQKVCCAQWTDLLAEEVGRNREILETTS
ncbi:MAG: glycosyltransferase WbuB [Bacteroidetes bacterium SW_9_63_38]|nr:MAG: glycosyltransferase WbuB [Bacteroidetes bacterium SW_9_63_38]